MYPNPKHANMLIINLLTRSRSIFISSDDDTSWLLFFFLLMKNVLRHSCEKKYANPVQRPSWASQRVHQRTREQMNNLLKLKKGGGLEKT